MNDASLRALLIEELRNLTDGHREVLRAFDAFPDAALNRPTRHLLESVLGATRRQLGLLEGAFERMDVPSAGGRSEGIRGIVRELEAVVILSGGNDPANLDPRMLALLRKLLGYRIAALKSALVVAHTLSPGGFENAVLSCLQVDLAGERHLDEIASAVVTLGAATTAHEVEKATRSLVGTP